MIHHHLDGSQIELGKEKEVNLPVVESGSAGEVMSSGLSDFSKWLLSLPSPSPAEKGENFKKGEFLAEKEAVSASLAELLTAQGHYNQAIAMYEKLQLKNPEKSAYFAAQIQKLKAL